MSPHDRDADAAALDRATDEALAILAADHGAPGRAAVGPVDGGYLPFDDDPDDAGPPPAAATREVPPLDVPFGGVRFYDHAGPDPYGGDAPHRVHGALGAHGRADPSGDAGLTEVWRTVRDVASQDAGPSRQQRPPARRGATGSSTGVWRSVADGTSAGARRNGTDDEALTDVWRSVRDVTGDGARDGSRGRTAGARAASVPASAARETPAAERSTGRTRAGSARSRAADDAPAPAAAQGRPAPGDGRRARDGDAGRRTDASARNGRSGRDGDAAPERVGSSAREAPGGAGSRPDGDGAPGRADASTRGTRGTRGTQGRPDEDRSPHDGRDGHDGRDSRDDEDAARDPAPGGDEPSGRPATPRPGGTDAPPPGSAPAGRHEDGDPTMVRQGAGHHVTTDTTDRLPPTPWPTAGRIAAGAAEALAPEEVPLGEALGRTLAEGLAALTDLPSFDTSAMDGWAVAGPGPWRLPERPAGEGIVAGQTGNEPLRDGCAVPIATGARVPPGATAVLRREHGRTTAQGELYATRRAGQGQDIRPRGQECRSGDELLPAGSPVTPAVLGLAAAAGYDALSVTARPRVEILVLGDELVHEGLPHDGRIRDALGPMLGPWLRTLGAEVAAEHRLGDDADALHDALAASDADLVITTGSTAAGPRDHLHPALRRLGAELLVDGVAVRPGHPMLLARLAENRHLVGLPGNPLAAVAGLLTLAEPLLRTLSGRTAPSLRRAVPAGPVPSHPADTRLVPVVLRGGDGARPLRFHGPAMLRGLAAADAMAVIPPGGSTSRGRVALLDLPW
ncbi:hypothetical protein I5Q34_10405 [Streptomyces sp. AV19]|nr:hypothetical protein [Streptomyces sp. AV19]